MESRAADQRQGRLEYAPYCVSCLGRHRCALGDRAVRYQRVNDDGSISRAVRTDRYVTGFRQRHRNIGHVHDHGDQGLQEKALTLQLVFPWRVRCHGSVSP